MDDMMSLSLRYTIVPKFQSCEDIRNELNNICNLRAKHELICRSFDRWQTTMDQNSNQLEILNNTATALRGRHKSLTDALALQPRDPAILKRLQRDICGIESQIYIWMRELTEIKDDRFRMDYNHAVVVFPNLL